MKKIMPYLAIVLAVAAIGLWMKSCRADAKYRQAKLEYVGYRAVAEADHEIQMRIIKEHLDLIAKKDAQIAQYVEEIQTYHVEISALQAELSMLQNGEPATTPDIEALPIVVNLRGQVRTLTEMFNLSRQENETKDKIILAWEGKYNAQVGISEAWEKQYENEHNLRLSCESLNKALEGSVRGWRLKGKVLGVAAAVAGGYIGLRLLTK